jgi:hypothetical protein
MFVNHAFIYRRDNVKFYNFKYSNFVQVTSKMLAMKFYGIIMNKCFL